MIQNLNNYLTNNKFLNDSFNIFKNKHYEI